MGVGFRTGKGETCIQLERMVGVPGGQWWSSMGAISLSGTKIFLLLGGSREIKAHDEGKSMIQMKWMDHLGRENGGVWVVAKRIRHSAL